MKVVINTCYGGFGLSQQAADMIEALLGDEYCEGLVERHAPELVKVVEALGQDANDAFSELKVVEIPEYADYTISEYDGCETLRWFLRPEEKLRRIKEACPQLSTEEAMNLIDSLWEEGHL